MWQDIVKDVLSAVVILLFTILVKEVVPYLRQRYAESVVFKAVQAAEQTLIGGAVKKEAVVALVTPLLTKLGYTDAEINCLIEGIVYVIKQEKKE